MPRQGQHSDEQTARILKSFVFQKECSQDLFPSDLKPKLVSDFIRDEVPPDALERPVSRVSKLARFYNLRDRAEQLVDMIPGNERKPIDVQRSCHLIIAVAELGDAGQHGQVAQAFDKLVFSSGAGEVYEDLINTFFSLSPKASPDALTQSVGDARARVEKSGPAGQLGQLMNYDIRDIPAMLEEKARKDGLLTLQDLPLRRQRYSEVYLQMDRKSAFLWDQQAGYALLQDARNLGEPAGDTAAIVALAAAMERIDPNADPELIKFQKTRGYRARRFFNEVLDEEIEDDAKDSLRPQDDLLM